MHIRPLAFLLLCLAAAAPARAADTLLDRLATCQESWYDAKGDPVKSKALGDAFNSAFTPDGNRGTFKPAPRTTVIGLPVAQATPESVGMAVGFSVTVNATFETAKAALEKAIGKSLTQCETGDGMRMCELEVGEKRTVTLMADASGKSKQALVGCYYFYQQ